MDLELSHILTALLAWLTGLALFVWLSWRARLGERGHPVPPLEAEAEDDQDDAA